MQIPKLLLKQAKKLLSLLAMSSAAFIMIVAPLAGASIAPDELDDFAKWPIYQECGAAQENVIQTATAGLTITGSSPFLQGNPMTIRYPNITDQARFAAAMEAFIKKAAPNSPWAKISNIGNKLADEGKKLNVNPMMIIVIGRHETNFASDGGGSAKQNNSFGNKSGGGYKYWPSVEDSLFGGSNFIMLVRDRIEQINGAPTNYKDAKNMYEYLSVHVSGQIIYPGDATSVFDPLMKVNVTSKNAEQYFSLARQWIGEMTGLQISGIPDRSTKTPSPTETAAAQASAKCQTDDATNTAGVVTEGYAFPLEDQTKRNYGETGPGPQCKSLTGCHHTGGVSGTDPQAAFDLMYGGNANMSGKKVYAISDGWIIRRNNAYRDVKGCYSIQFVSSKDNYHYWYGHLQKADESIPEQNPTKDKPAVKAGQQLAEVASTGMGPRCHGRADNAPPGPHLHIDRGCIKNGRPQDGGGGICRDVKFIDFLTKLWEKLPASGGGNKAV